MTREFGLPRSFLIYAICLPLAVFLGYLLATPESVQSYAFLILVLFVISFPFWLRHHHEMLICVWNATIILPMPGKPTLWMVMAGISLSLSILQRTMNKKYLFLEAPSVTRPLLLLTMVVIATVVYTGGIGSRAFGSEIWGAKRYVGVFGAVLGYFALTAHPLPPKRAKLCVYLFFLSSMTGLGSDLIFAAGEKFYFLFTFFPTEYAGLQAVTQSQTALLRLTGPTFAALALFYFMFARYGIRGIFDFFQPWRAVALALILSVSLLGGYRSAAILILVIFLTQFYLEGLVRSRFFPSLILMLVLMGSLILGFVNKLPLSVQRSLSFLPINVDPIAKQDAAGTLDWRLQMWKTLLPEVPQYLLLGKGYAYSGTDYYLTQEAIRRGFFTTYEDTLISGNYHNGILTLIIPFGIFALLAFSWFCWSSLRILHRNYLYGPPEYSSLNTFIFALFLGRLVFYVVFYGQFDLDFFLFTGLIGLSISLNGGVCQPPQNQPRKIFQQAEARIPLRRLPV